MSQRWYSSSVPFKGINIFSPQMSSLPPTKRRRGCVCVAEGVQTLKILSLFRGEFTVAPNRCVCGGEHGNAEGRFQTTQNMKGSWGSCLRLCLAITAIMFVYY